MMSPAARAQMGRTDTREVGDPEEVAARLRTAMSAGRIGHFDWEIATKRVVWSPELEAMHGYPPGGFPGTEEAYVAEILPEDRPRVFASMRRAIDEGALHEVTYRIVTPQGRVRWVEGRGTVLRAPDGTPLRLLGVCSDVTARKEAELGLHRSERRFRLLAEVSAMLASGRDTLAAMQGVAELLVRELADGATIDLAGEGDRLERVATAHADPREPERARADSGSRPLRAPDAISPARVVRTGAPELLSELDDRALRSALCVPIAARYGAHGALTLVLSAETERRFDEADLETAVEVARRIAVELERARLLDDARASRVAADGAARRAAFVAEASRRLAEPLALDALLQLGATLGATELGDWCFADLVDEAGVVHRIGAAHRDPRGAEIAARFKRRYPPLEDVPYGVTAAVRAGSTQVIVPVTDEILSALARDEEHLQCLRALGAHAFATLPLRARGRTLGTLVLVRSGGGWSEDELVLAEKLASRVALAVDNVRLYEEAKAAEARAHAATRRLGALLEVSLAVSQAGLDERAIAEAVVGVTSRDLFDGAALLACASGEGTLQIAAFSEPERGAPSAVARAIRATERGEGTLPALERELAASGVVGKSIVVPVHGHGELVAVLVAWREDALVDDGDVALCEELGRRVGGALENARLYAEARDASRAKDEFLATVSHELRTPMNAILGWASLLTDARGPGSIERGIEVIARNARAQARLIDDVLDISRIVAGKLSLERRSFCLEPRLRASLETIAPAAAARGVTVETEIDPELGVIAGDPDRIQQIVWNLLSNAVKFASENGRVSLTARRGPGAVSIVVTDDGTGIGPEFLPHVFERFRQADGSLTRRHGGLGLGLAIAKRLVELHRGTISASSQGLGKGATFRVVLPVSASALAPEEPSGAHVLGAPRLDGVGVLVVDDEPDARDLLAALLSQRGASVRTAGGAREALERAREELPDVLVSDLAMPGEDGCELVARVRALGSGPRGPLRAVALTAMAREVDRSRAIAAGFDEHCAKPIEPESLVRVVAQLAAQRRDPRRIA